MWPILLSYIHCYRVGAVAKVRAYMWFLMVLTLYRVPTLTVPYFRRVPIMRLLQVEPPFRVLGLGIRV